MKSTALDAKSQPAIVHLGVNADVVAAVEAMRFNSGNPIYIVLPKRPCSFRNSFNLNLLRQVGLILKKEFVLVSDHPVVIDLAKKLQIQLLEQLNEQEILQPSKAAAPKEPAALPEASELPAGSEQSISNRLTDIVAAKTLKGTKSPAQAKSKKKLEVKKPIIETDVKVETSQAGETKSPKLKQRRSPPLFATDDERRPSSGRLRTYMVGLILAVLLGAVILIYALWPKTATIIIKTEVSQLSPVDIELNLRQGLETSELASKTLNLEMFSTETIISQAVTASGQLPGQRAQGVIEIYNCSTTQPLVINSLTIFRKDDQDFRLQATDFEVSIEPAVDQANCQGTGGVINRRSLRIIASQAGTAYNLSEGSYQIVGVDAATYNVIGQAMEGGQAPVACLTAEDLNQISAVDERYRDESAARQALEELINKETFDDGADYFIPLPEIFQVALGELQRPATCSELRAGIAVNNEVSQQVTYWMGAVKKSEVEALIKPELVRQAAGLDIKETGLQTAEFSAYRNPEFTGGGEPTATSPAKWQYYVLVNVREARAGKDLRPAQIIEEAVGMKSRTVGANLRRLQGVRDVQVQLSPWWAFWLTELPDDPNYIEVEIKTTEDG